MRGGGGEGGGIVQNDTVEIVRKGGNLIWGEGEGEGGESNRMTRYIC